MVGILEVKTTLFSTQIHVNHDQSYLFFSRTCKGTVYQYIKKKRVKSPKNQSYISKPGRRQLARDALSLHKIKADRSSVVDRGTKVKVWRQNAGQRENHVRNSRTVRDKTLCKVK